MKTRTKLYSGLMIFIYFMIITCPGNTQTIICRIKGTIVDRKSDQLILLPETEDPRFNGIKIRIVNDQFDYQFTVKDILQYNLIFQEEFERGAWKPIEFFPQSGNINFTLYPTENFKQNIIKGGTLNQKKIDFDHLSDSVFSPMFQPYTMVLDSLWKANAYFSEKVIAINNQLRDSTDETVRAKLFRERQQLENSGQMYSIEAASQLQKVDSVERIRMYWMDDYLQSNIDLFSFSLIYSSLKRYNQTNNGVDIPFINEIFPKFQKKYPDHPYTVIINQMLQAINKLKIGNTFVDFEAPTLNGKIIRISDSIKGKVALIDLWASWCLPCRALNKTMIPVYDKYKSKGFTIIGVACEFKNSDAMQIAIERDQYPWLNLVELDNRNGIWRKYNIAGSGGSTFLVDKNGIIVAIHPDAQELDKKLEELLK